MPDTTTSLPQTPSRSRRLLQYSLSIILTVVFLVLAFHGTDFGKLYESITGANYWWILAYVLVLLVSHVLRAWRWRYLLEPIKPRIGLRNLFSGVMVGYMMNNVLPRAGELVRPYVLGKLESISKSAAFGTIVVERILDTFSFLVIVAALPLLYHGPMEESFPWLVQGGAILTALTAAFLLVVVALMIRRDLTDRLLGSVTRFLPHRLGRRVERLFHSFLDGFLFLKRPGNYLIIGILSVLIWFLYAVMVYCSLIAFGIETTVGFSGAVVLLAITSIGVAIPTPGSTGSYHAFTSQGLVRLFSIGQETALSLATVTHAVGFLLTTSVGLYYFLRDRISMAEALKKEPERKG